MSHAPLPPEPRLGFSHQLKQAEALAHGPTVRVADLAHLFQGRAFASAIAVLCLPFLQPLPVPGLSVVLGLVIAVLGARLVGGQPDVLPDFLARREIDSGKLLKVLQGARKLFGRLDPVFSPRLLALVDPPLDKLVGIGAIIGGLAMALPLPPLVLFSNGLPAFGTLLLCLGWIERDGLCVLFGHIVVAATWLYFGTWWAVLKLALDEAWRRYS